MKVAYLVDYSIMTRIVIETDGKTDDEIEDELHDKAFDKITSNDVIGDYICPYNMDFVEDDECPAGTDPND